MSLESFIRAMPKAELHIHLEGSIRPHTLLQLAQRNGVELPFRDEAELHEYYRFTDFPHFIEVWYVINQALRTTADFTLITYELGKEAAQQHTRYLEVTFTPTTTVRRLGISYDDLLAAINVGAARAEREFGVVMRWINDVDRELDPQLALTTVNWAKAAKHRGVVALGLGGFEPKGSPAAFVPAFDIAVEAGLHRTPHQGEYAAPESIWQAARLLRAERIGHGIHAATDPALMQYLAEQRIALEICPTSNVCTRVVDRLADHPIATLYAAGVPITLNSDDPAMFNTTLTNEYLLTAQHFGFSADQLAQISLNAVRYSFQPEADKQRMIAEFEAEFVLLRKAHLSPSAVTPTD
jgi:adenosine deaminase